MSAQRDPVDAAAPPSRAGVLPLIGGALCLDFANTSSGRGTVRHRENLASYDLLLVWCAHAGLIGPRERSALSRLAAADPKKAANLLRRARALREAIHAIVAAIARKEPPPEQALALLNREFSRVMGTARLSHCGDHFVLAHDIATDRLEGLLPPIVRSAAELLLKAAPERLRQCPGQHCGWVFLDRTRNGRRRWCEMEVCGARAKLRRFRARRRRIRA